MTDMKSDTASQGATERIARFVHGARFEDLPQSTRHAARRAFVNIIGCCIGGARHDIVSTTAQAFMPFSGAGTTTVLGRAERADMLTAALLNCLSSAAYSFDDTHAETILHPSGAVATALLAVAEQNVMTGQEFLLAFVLGVDIACRVSKAVSVAPANGNIAWSQTGIAAGIGAAAAAAKVLNLDPQGITRAIGLAALQASGFREAHGTMSGTFIMGVTAQAGLRAALLAHAGMTAPAAPLEGKYGYASLFSEQPHMAYLTHSLGIDFEVEALAYKPYPCGVVTHPAVDAALAWQLSQMPDPARVHRVLVKAHPAAMALGFRRHPATVLEAKVSFFHWVGVALAFGRAGLAEGEQRMIDDPEVTRLRSCIEVESDEAVAKDAAIMTVTLENGDSKTIAIDHCRGSVKNPMTDDDISEKFLGQAHRISATTAVPLLASCWGVQDLQDVSAVSKLTRSSSPTEPNE